MKSVMAVRHLHFEDLGTFESVLRENNYYVTYVEASTDDLTQLDPFKPDLLVVLGGPIGAFDDETYPFVVEELNIVRRRLHAKLPILGICLGAQLMARALGAQVYSMGKKEIGFGPIEVTDDGRASVLSAMGATEVLHWHGDQFDIPPGARSLARTSVCPNQAFSMGDYALGLQFHIEADTRMLERWLVGHASELAQAGIDPRELRRVGAQSNNSLARAARHVLTTWLEKARLARKEF